VNLWRMALFTQKRGIFRSMYLCLLFPIDCQYGTRRRNRGKEGRISRALDAPNHYRYLDTLVQVVARATGRGQFLQEFTTVRPSHLSATDTDRVIRNPDSTWSHLGKVFALRHILRHEVAADLEGNDADFHNHRRSLSSIRRSRVRGLFPVLPTDKLRLCGSTSETRGCTERRMLSIASMACNAQSALHCWS
jgi:hypothetical protein